MCVCVKVQEVDDSVHDIHTCHVHHTLQSWRMRETNLENSFLSMCKLSFSITTKNNKLLFLVSNFQRSLLRSISIRLIFFLLKLVKGLYHFFLLYFPTREKTVVFFSLTRFYCAFALKSMKPIIEFFFKLFVCLLFILEGGKPQKSSHF